MRLRVEMRNSLHRLIDDKTGKIALNRFGEPKDGGGFLSRSFAKKQASLLNKEVDEK